MNCYILVGGRSKRFGRSKAEAFLDRVVAAARPAFGEIFAVQRPGGDAMSIETVFEEPHDDDGPIFGLVAALKHAGQRCFILAVDYPFITTEVLAFLRDDGRVPEGQPLCAVWDPALLPALEARIASRRRDLHGLWERAMMPASELHARFSGAALRNVNRPEDWEDVN